MCNIFYGILGVLIYFASEELVIQSTYSILRLKNYSSDKIFQIMETNYYKLDMVCLLVTLIFLLIFISIRSKKLRGFTRTNYLQFKFIGFRDLLDSTILLLGVKGIIDIWFMILDSLALKSNFINQLLDNFAAGPGNTSYSEPYIYLVLSVVILGPLVEELVFRGIVYRELSLGINKKLAILLSGLAFGIFHWNIIQFTYTVLIGLLLAYLYKRYENFALPVYLHILNNFLESLPRSIDNLYLVHDIITILGLVSIVISIKILFRFKKEDNNRIFR